MCGRFNSIASGKDFAYTYSAEFLGDELMPNFNVAPTTPIYILRQDGERRIVETMTWGLVPSWSKDKTRSASMINARSETIAEKPSFRNLVSKHRCIIPIQGFYEWEILASDTKRPKKQAHYIWRTDERVMTLAGLWTSWKQPDSQILRSCTIITIDANSKLAPIHHRMPVILDGNAMESWLNEATPEPLAVLRACENEIVASQPTSRLGRAVKTSTPQLNDDATGRLF